MTENCCFTAFRHHVTTQKIRSTWCIMMVLFFLLMAFCSDTRVRKWSHIVSWLCFAISFIFSVLFRFKRFTDAACRYPFIVMIPFLPKLSYCVFLVASRTLRFVDLTHIVVTSVFVSCLNGLTMRENSSFIYISSVFHIIFVWSVCILTMTSLRGGWTSEIMTFCAFQLCVSITMIIQSSYAYRLTQNFLDAMMKMLQKSGMESEEINQFILKTVPMNALDILFNGDLICHKESESVVKSERTTENGKKEKNDIQALEQGEEILNSPTPHFSLSIQSIKDKENPHRTLAVDYTTERMHSSEACALSRNLIPQEEKKDARKSAIPPFRGSLNHFSQPPSAPQFNLSTPPQYDFLVEGARNAVPAATVSSPCIPAPLNDLMVMYFNTYNQHLHFLMQHALRQNLMASKADAINVPSVPINNNQPPEKAARSYRGNVEAPKRFCGEFKSPPASPFETAHFSPTPVDEMELPFMQHGNFTRQDLVTTCQVDPPLSFGKTTHQSNLASSSYWSINQAVPVAVKDALVNTPGLFESLGGVCDPSKLSSPLIRNSCLKKVSSRRLFQRRRPPALVVGKQASLKQQVSHDRNAISVSHMQQKPVAITEMNNTLDCVSLPDRSPSPEAVSPDLSTPSLLKSTPCHSPSSSTSPRQLNFFKKALVAIMKIPVSSPSRKLNKDDENHASPSPLSSKLPSLGSDSRWRQQTSPQKVNGGCRSQTETRMHYSHLISDMMHDDVEVENNDPISVPFNSFPSKFDVKISRANSLLSSVEMRASSPNIKIIPPPLSEESNK
eukprot:GDKK01061110.1.p1 GENE.GDKK01061110.1~~GDKK01061110.1.p1  ORF type:complete len:785 (-),score=168.46 GDKK01061110.1:178-2532(-)